MSYTDLFSFYRSKEWESLRKQITLSRVDTSGDLHCEMCNKVLLRPYDAICHHIQELDESNVHDVSISLNPSNIMVVCHRCHNKIHDRWQGGKPTGTRHIYVVHGSPCAGKSKYVMDSAGKGDLIIDIDRLYDAMSTNQDRTSIKSNVLSVYRSLIDMVKTRNGRWRTAWIVRTLPLNIDRESILRELGGAELVHIDTDHDTCLIEAKARGGQWVDWVEQYWSRYQPPE